LDTIYAQGSKVFIFDGTNWQGADNGVKDGNVQIGYKANGSSTGTAFGNGAYGYTSGVAIGAYSNGSVRGATVGYSANGSNYGATVGNNANGTNYGSALGYYAGNGKLAHKHKHRAICNITNSSRKPATQHRQRTIWNRNVCWHKRIQCTCCCGNDREW